MPPTTRTLGRPSASVALTLITCAAACSIVHAQQERRLVALSRADMQRTTRAEASSGEPRLHPYLSVAIERRAMFVGVDGARDPIYSDERPRESAGDGEQPTTAPRGPVTSVS